MFLEMLKRNPGLKVLCLILAFFLWAYVKYSQGPSTMITQSRIIVPVTCEGVSDGQITVMNVPDSVALTVKGTYDTISRLTPQNFKAYMDLKDKNPGTYRTEIKISYPPGVELVNKSPENVSVIIDSVEKRLFNIAVKTEGTVAKGFIIGGVRAKPESVTVSGAKSLISRIKEIRTSVNLEGVDMDTVSRCQVEVVDETNNVIETLKTEPEFVRVSANILPEFITRTIPVIPVIKGAPAEGFGVGKVEIKPAVISIRQRFDIEDPPDSIKTDPFSIEGKKESQTVNIGLESPENISPLEPNQKVELFVEIKKKKD